MTEICLNQIKGSKYPSKEFFFRPDKMYPEYIFSQDISKEENIVYDMVRNSFAMLGMDRNNFGTAEWNPLKDKVKPGNNVLIKPNMVLHSNTSGCGEECLYTHPSLVAALVDYVIIALRGEGKIVIGDAPLQECNFNVLIEDSGYKQLVDYYKSKGICIDLVDFRNVKTYTKDGLHYLCEKEGNEGIVVQLNEKSAFHGMKEKRIKNLRITNYDPRILQKHHDEERHEYRVAKYVLDADVIINMPKPKTHRKAGVTISLKNLVGINANKEYLPHHTLGSKEEGGDAYEKENFYLTKANEILDLRNELVHDGDTQSAAIAEKLYDVLVHKGIDESGEKYWEGSWYGNDTIWRTITDLNRIVYYADKNGIIKNTKQRKQLIVGDMIVSGQKEGPLEPVPIYPGVVAIGDDPVVFDRAVCSIMGFDYNMIPSLCSTELTDARFSVGVAEEYDIVSNNANWNRRKYEEIVKDSSMEFQPSAGWMDKLGNKYIDKLVEKVWGQQVYIFGAGINGRYALELLSEKKIIVAGFFDNNKDLWGKEVERGIMCYKPDEIQEGMVVIGGVKDKYVAEIKKMVLGFRGIYIGSINRG